MNRSIVLRTLPVIALAVCAVSCASAQQQQSMVRSKATYDEVWKACIDSLFDVNFSASSADPKTGLIVADQAVVLGHGTVVRLNIMVTRAADGTEVSVNFVPPPGTFGGVGIVDNYAKALKKRVPDIEVTKVK
jgi:hypothetical protein